MNFANLDLFFKRVSTLHSGISAGMTVSRRLVYNDERSGVGTIWWIENQIGR